MTTDIYNIKKEFQLSKTKFAHVEQFEDAPGFFFLRVYELRERIDTTLVSCLVHDHWEFEKPIKHVVKGLNVETLKNSVRDIISLRILFEYLGYDELYFTRKSPGQSPTLHRIKLIERGSRNG